MITQKYLKIKHLVEITFISVIIKIYKFNYKEWVLKCYICYGKDRIRVIFKWLIEEFIIRKDVFI